MLSMEIWKEKYLFNHRETLARRRLGKGRGVQDSMKNPIGLFLWLEGVSP